MADSGVVSAAFTINLGAPAWFNNSWSSRKAVTIPSTSGSSTLANFPVLISLASDANLMSLAQASGNDILFTAADGTTKLNHEMELYNSWNYTGAGSQQLTIQSLGNTGNLVTSTATLADNTWHKVDVTIGSNNLVSLYVDGALNGSAISPTAPASLTGTIRLGQYGGDGYFYHGLVDELRISNTVRSAAWIATEFSNQSSPATFFTLGAAQ